MYSVHEIMTKDQSGAKIRRTIHTHKQSQETRAHKNRRLEEERVTSKNTCSNTCAAAHRHVAKHVLGVLWFNNFDWTAGFYWSCMLFL